jgi:hypothetical protein
MRKQQRLRQALAALLSLLLLAFSLAPALAADIEQTAAPEQTATPEQPAIYLHWTNENGEYVTVFAQYAGMAGDMHAYWLQLTDPFVIQNRLGSIAYSVSDQAENAVFDPDPTVGINLTDKLDVPMLITNITEQRGWVLTVSLLPMPVQESPVGEPVDPDGFPVETPAPETAESAPETPVSAPETAEPAPETAEPAPETAEPTPETAESAPETPEVEPFDAYALVAAKSAARMRSVPGATDPATILGDVPGNELVYIDGKVTLPDFPWYRINRIVANNAVGYMRGDLLRLIDEEEAARLLYPDGTPEPAPTQEPTPEPSAEPIPVETPAEVSPEV